jgi:DNA-directed RNA polymerase subunit H (RpoH/RPB5)
MEELWEELNGFKGKYSISNKGRIRNNETSNVLKPYDNKGYLRINLYNEGKIERKLIHRLVAKYFLVNRDGKEQVNHKDLDKRNNSVDNLEWISDSDNVEHAINNIEGREEYLKEKMAEIGKEYYKIGVEASKKAVAKLDGDNNIIEIYESARSADRKTDASYRGISKACNGNIKTHKGFKWKFIDKEGATTIETQ